MRTRTMRRAAPTWARDGALSGVVAWARDAPPPLGPSDGAFGRGGVGPGMRLALEAVSAWGLRGREAPRARGRRRWGFERRRSSCPLHGSRALAIAVLVSWGRGFGGGWFRLVRGSRRGR